MIDRVIEINEKEISVGQDLTLSHAGTVWDGALTMVYFWNKNKHIANDYLSSKTVLQLGSGTGIVGISATAFNPKKVYLTDLPEYLKILEINQQKNLNLSLNPDCLHVRKLEWNNPSDMSAITGIDTLIGSQLAYDKQNVIRLMETIKYYRTVNPKLKVMIAYQRYVQEWKNLEIKFAQYFPGEFKTVPW